MAPRVLVIDDHVELAATIAQNLREVLGAQVDQATDAASGLKAAARHGFDVALVDVKLPDGLGVDLVAPLLSLSPFGEVVVVTGHASVDVAIAALRAGAFAFLLKSFRPEELHSTVDQALRKVALKRERAILEQRHRALVEGADILIVGLSPDGRVCLLNPRTARLAGVQPSEVMGMPFAERFIVPSDRDSFVQAVRDASYADRAVEIEAGILDASGGVARISWHVFGARDANGAVELVYGLGRDVTERRALERRAADAEALASMGQLTLGLTHAIRNPLNAAVLQLQLLGREVSRLHEAERRTAMGARVDIVHAEIARVGRLLNDFMELARPRQLRRERVEISALMSHVLELQADATARHGVRVSALLDENAYVWGDPEKLRVVWGNLVANALDAMPSGGCLQVQIEASTESVSVTITDDGPGIDAAVSSEIFDPFFTTKEAGTGLGLSIVRKIVDQHGGKIDIASAIGGKGTRVRVNLPR